jgi:succinylarginine dihydrolase
MRRGEQDDDTRSCREKEQHSNPKEEASQKIRKLETLIDEGKLDETIEGRKPPFSP